MADDTSRTSDSAVELAEPEALDLAFNAVSAKLNRQKDKLLSYLYTVYDQAPRAQLFDAERAWRGLESVARLGVAPGTAKRLAKNLHERKARKDEIADALQKARELTEKPTVAPDRAGAVVLPWWETFGAEGVFTSGNESTGAAAMIGVYEEAARQTEGKDESRRGSKVDLVLPWLIGHLIDLYREATCAELKPGISGPFPLFASQFLAAIGRRRDWKDICKATKAVLKQEKAIRERAEANPIEGLGF